MISQDKAIFPKESPIIMREEPKEAVLPIQPAMTSAIPARSRLCADHQRKLEVVCIDHQTRICTNCALFGFHKNHNIKPEDDVLLEITTRAESLLNLFQEIDSNQKYLDSPHFIDFYSSKIKDKELELYHALNSKFEVSHLLAKNPYISAGTDREDAFPTGKTHPRPSGKVQGSGPEVQNPLRVAKRPYRQNRLMEVFVIKSIMP